MIISIDEFLLCLAATERAGVSPLLIGMTIVGVLSLFTLRYIGETVNMRAATLARYIRGYGLYVYVVWVASLLLAFFRVNYST